MIINWIQPYCVDKNIGKEYNRMIELMPDNQWIGLVDHDAMFLRPDSKMQIADVVEKHGAEYDVFGALTNRLFGEHQRYNGVFSEVSDINHHIDIANKVHQSHYDSIIETKINLAGLCMVFKKSTWRRVGEFKENSICLDREFTDAVMNACGKLAIMQGVYVFHLYRWGRPSPGQYIKHLL